MQKYNVEKPKLEIIEKDWSYKKTRLFELENLVRRCEALEDYLIAALQENRNIMSTINNERLAYMPTSLEHNDLVQERIIKLPGLTEKEQLDWYK